MFQEYESCSKAGQYGAKSNPLQGGTTRPSNKAANMKPKLQRRPQDTEDDRIKGHPPRRVAGME